MDVLEKPGKKVVLLGNEAIARGALEAGVGVVAAYPGTPSSEVPITFSRIAKKTGVYFEYSTNEKVAFETAAAAAWTGARAMTAMKHFGLNVASDSVGPLAYTGVKGGLVVMVADDPQGWSSAQSEQDMRYYARMFRMPTIEPSNPQECLEYTRMCFDLSEEFEIPVFLRTTTKVSHSISTVKLGRIKKPKKKGKFVKDSSKYLLIRPNLQKAHRDLDKKLERIEKKYGKKLNKAYPGKGDVGIIVTGVNSEYLKEALQDLGAKPPVAKIGLSHPISKDFIAKFIKGKKAVLVLEELEPILENEVRMIAKDTNPNLKIHGKDMLPRDGEYNLEVITPALAKVLKKRQKVNFAKHTKMFNKAVKGLPPRKPVFCPGCPHRSTFFAARQVFNDKTVFAGDVGCYVLGLFEPYHMQDFMVSMGASMGLAHGITRTSDQEVIAFIGDSTFFHASMPGLVNMQFNNGKTPLVLILDNSITAMTGHQPHPGTGVTGMGDAVKPVSIENICKAYGAEVRVVNAYSQKDLIKNLKELRKKKGLRVLISRGECRLLTRRKQRAKGQDVVKFEVVTHDDLSVLTDQFACPAIKEVRKKKGDKPKYVIDPRICAGCAVCAQIAPGKVRPIRKGAKK